MRILAKKRCRCLVQYSLLSLLPTTCSAACQTAWLLDWYTSLSGHFWSSSFCNNHLQDSCSQVYCAVGVYRKTSAMFERFVCSIGCDLRPARIERAHLHCSLCMMLPAMECDQNTKTKEDDHASKGLARKVEVAMLEASSSLVWLEMCIF